MRILWTIISVTRFFLFLFRYNFFLLYAKYLNARGRVADRDAFIFPRIEIWGRYVVNLSKATVEVHGAEKLPQDTAVVFIGNHQGYFDIPVLLGYVSKPKAFIAKIEILKIPMLAGWMKLMQCTFLDRKNPRQSIKAMAEAVESVKKGYSLVIFPEGHRSKGGPLGDFKAGSFKLAFKARVPIVPITFDGTWRLFEEKGGLQKSHVVLTVHDPIPTAGLTREEQALIPERVKAIIASALPETGTHQ